MRNATELLKIIYTNYNIKKKKFQNKYTNYKKEDKNKHEKSI